MDFLVERGNLFVKKENKDLFNELCDKMKKHPFESPWKMCFIDSMKDKNFLCGVQELYLPGFLHKRNLSSKQISHVILDKQLETNILPKMSEKDQVKLKILENSIKQSLETLTENLQGMDLICTIHPAQVPILCNQLENVMLNDLAVTLFLNSILSFTNSLNLSIANALVNCLIYPRVFENNRKNVSRNLLTSVLNFTGVYPRAVIDRVVVPYLKQSDPATLQFETILKMAKNIFPNRCVAYVIESIIEEAMPIENTFMILQALIERRIPLESQLHRLLAWKVENWSITWNKSVKFTKFLISILSVYGSQLGEEPFFIYTNVLRLNDTIMKKAAESVLKRLNRQS